MYTLLRQLRERYDLSQEDMAVFLNLSGKSAYNKKELGIRRFTLREALIIAHLFGASVEEVFVGDGDGDG